MNFDYYEKILALPLKSTMKGVLRTLVYHCNPKLDNRCIPSRKTIISESSVSSDTVGDSIRIAVILGIITKRHRGDIATGKKADEYFFNFDDLGFYKSKGKWILPKNKLIDFKQNYAIAKQTIKDEDKLEGKKRNTTFPDKTTYQTNPIKPDTRFMESLKKPDTGMSYTQGLEGYSIKPDTRPIEPDTGTEVIGHKKNHLTVSLMIQPINLILRKVKRRFCIKKKVILLKGITKILTTLILLRKKILPSSQMLNGWQILRMPSKDLNSV